MTRVSHSERRLLILLLPLWLVCLGLHVKEILRTSFAEPPIYAAPAQVAGGHPSVGGFRMERGRGGDAFEVGDTLLRLGDVDLEGVGYLGFDAIALEQAGRSLRAPIWIERRGEQRELVLELLPSALPWHRVVPIVAWVIVATLILIRAPGWSSRMLFAATLAISILQTQFYGGPRWQTWASLAVFHGMGGIAFVLALRWAICFPYEVPATERISPAWAWLGGCWWLVRIGYFVPTPIPSDRVPLLTITFDAFFMLGMLAIITRNYRRSDPIGRRRVKWMLLGGYLGAAPLGLVALLPLLAPGLARFDLLFETGVMLLVLVPVGMLIAVLRYNLYDVDRLISVTASYTGLGVLLLATALTMLPMAAEAASSILGIDQSFGQTAISLLLAFAVVPAHQRLRPQIERLFFRERHAIEAGIEALLRELSQAPDPEALTRLSGERLDALLRPETSVVYVRRGGAFEPAFVRGRAVPPAFDGASPLVSTLERRPGALTAELVSEGRREQIGSFERAALETLGVPLVLPVRRGTELVAFLCLGPKRSGDVYTSTDLALLGAVADKVSSELQRFDQAQLLDAGRAMQESLRRYVPGAVAEQLESGADLESGEREVTVLFVDIRSYTSYAESRAAEEIFSTVNRFTDLVSRTVRAFGGAVVEFNGDGMMTVFGAPRPLPERERAAVRAACEIVDSVAALPLDGERRLAVGIGIATGPAFVGNIRAVDRMIWSAIGNTTNLAARLQQLTRELDSAIVVDRATWQAGGDAAAGWRAHPGTKVRGRSRPVDLYSLPAESAIAREGQQT